MARHVLFSSQLYRSVSQPGAGALRAAVSGLGFEGSCRPAGPRRSTLPARAPQPAVRLLFPSRQGCAPAEYTLFLGVLPAEECAGHASFASPYSGKCFSLNSQLRSTVALPTEASNRRFFSPDSDLCHPASGTSRGHGPIIETATDSLAIMAAVSNALCGFSCNAAGTHFAGAAELWRSSSAHVLWPSLPGVVST